MVTLRIAHRHSLRRRVPGTTRGFEVRCGDASAPSPLLVNVRKVEDWSTQG